MQAFIPIPFTLLGTLSTRTWFSSFRKLFLKITSDSSLARDVKTGIRQESDRCKLVPVAFTRKAFAVWKVCCVALSSVESRSC